MRVRKSLAESLNSPLVVSFGGGVNSAAMLIGMRDRGTCPDLILFSDTGGEKPETYECLVTINAWLAQSRFPLITTVAVYQNEKPIDQTLESSCLRLGVLPSIAYGWKTCSQRWKAEPQRKFLHSWAPALSAWQSGGRIRQAIGYDRDEIHRSLPDVDGTEWYYPLREWGWGRKECVAAIEAAGLPVPVKSACFFCPSSKKSEVIRLRHDHPDLFERAIAMERMARESGKSQVKGLGRDWSWESLVAADEAQFKLFSETVETPCMCFDGDDD